MWRQFNGEAPFNTRGGLGRDGTLVRLEQTAHRKASCTGNLTAVPRCTSPYTSCTSWASWVAHAPFSLLLIMGAGRGEKTAHAPFSVYVRADSEVDVKTFIVRGLLNNCIGSKGSKHRIVNGATLALPYAIALHGCIVGASCGNAATLT